jgi:tryptophan-specific transport protein
VAAIGYAGLFATLWAVAIPALLALRAEKRFATHKKSSLAITLVLLFGGLNIVAWLLSWLEWLPRFGPG